MYGIPQNLANVIKVEIAEGQPIVIKLTEVRWKGHYPLTNDIIFAELPEGATDKQISAQVKRLLKRKTYIRTCEHCGEYKINGWMHGKSCCQSCAEKCFDVVY